MARLSWCSSASCTSNASESTFAMQKRREKDRVSSTAEPVSSCPLEETAAAACEGRVRVVRVSI
eukprot:2651705-Pleurochrysis_carterae.AAC.2